MDNFVDGFYYLVIENNKGNDMKFKITNARKAIAVLVLVVIGQSLAFHDDVEQGKSNCDRATYAYDNPKECG